jgi:VIT1/CCC1 family predicted Fe2+/Mn2+ transporter
MKISNDKLNSLRAAVLGANDGILSIAGLLMGMAGSGSTLRAGIAATIAGAFSMATGEYVSVSTQRDSERSLLAKERQELADDPAGEEEELAEIYEDKGLDKLIAETIAEELTAKDAFGAHAEAELGINPNDIVSPIKAALSSAASFIVGAAIPLLATVLSPIPFRPYSIVFAVVAALALSGVLSAKMSNVPALWQSARRLLIWGIASMIVNYIAGMIFA